MRYLLAAFVPGDRFPASRLADAPAAEPAAIRATIDRGLKFLVSDAQAWRSEHNCVSCHHAGLVIWSLREAKQRGITVDEPALAELTTVDGGNGRRRHDRRTAARGQAARAERKGDFAGAGHRGRRAS